MKARAWIVGAVLTVAAGAGLAAQSPEQLAMIDHLRRFELGRLGNAQIKTDAIPPVRSTPDKPHRMLIIPVEYANVGFDRFKGESDAAEKNRAYFQELLFSQDLRAPRVDTLSHYYHHQSRGRYAVTGQVLPVVKVPEPSDFYGRPIQNSDGQWRNDVRAELLVEHALKAALERNPGFPWQDYDVFDPADYDGDGRYDEADGYIDHFVLVFAGKGQSSCQRQFSLDQKFTANAPATLYDTLQPAEQECAQRIWPHRFSLTVNNGKGPMVEGFANRRGGVALTEGLWVYDYNMQSEYTDISTFIHEFGHSIGLPDIYAMQTNNSTASWEAMSSTASPLPQELSAWSRLVLGWLEPCVITPRMAGGARVQSVYLKTMNDWSGVAGDANAAGLCDAAMVILPPKTRELRLGPLGPAQGAHAAYTGQGNDLNHYLSRSFDLRAAPAGPLTLELDTWFTIEADWDYLYVTASTDGVTYDRLMPSDKANPDDTDSVMPSKRGHDGLGTIPGFTGLSGDRNGDGRVETAAGCNPAAPRQTAEERARAGAGPDPCEAAQWVHASFDLSKYRDQRVEIRLHYFADMAAVEDGALVDNIAIPGIDFIETFESGRFDGWRVEGFSLSGGPHDLAVPHFYLLEYRDPYEKFASAKNYDSALAEPGFTFFRNEQTGAMEAVDFRYRPGVLAWYYNGEYLWSQNEPAEFGPGNGFLLLVDANPQEYAIPAVPASYLKTADGWSWFEFDDTAQASLRRGFLDVMCFQRRPEYYALDLAPADRTCASATPAAERGSYNGRPLMFGYALGNELLPGPARRARKAMGTLYDIRLAQGRVSFRLNDRLIRNQHSADAPFSLTPFENGLQFYTIGATGAMTPLRGVTFAPVRGFSDARPSRFLNPHLPFGSANTPDEGLNFELAMPGPQAPAGAKVKVYFTWDR